MGTTLLLPDFGYKILRLKFSLPNNDVLLVILNAFLLLAIVLYFYVSHPCMVSKKPNLKHKANPVYAIKPMI